VVKVQARANIGKMMRNILESDKISQDTMRQIKEISYKNRA